MNLKQITVVCVLLFFLYSVYRHDVDHFTSCSAYVHAFEQLDKTERHIVSNCGLLRSNVRDDEVLLDWCINFFSFGLFESYIYTRINFYATGACPPPVFWPTSYVGSLLEVANLHASCHSGILVRGVFMANLIGYLSKMLFTVSLGVLVFIIVRAGLTRRFFVLRSRDNVDPGFSRPKVWHLCSVFNRERKRLEAMGYPKDDNPHSELANRRKTITRAMAQTLHEVCHLDEVIDVCGVPARHSGKTPVRCVMPTDVQHTNKTDNGQAIIQFVDSEMEKQRYPAVAMMVDSDWHYTQEEIVAMFPKGVLICTTDFTLSPPDGEVLALSEQGVVGNIKGGATYVHGYHAWSQNGGKIVTHVGALQYSKIHSSDNKLVIYLEPIFGEISNVGALRSYGIRRVLGDGSGWFETTERGISRDKSNNWSVTATLETGEIRVIPVPKELILRAVRGVDFKLPNCHANTALLATMLLEATKTHPELGVLLPSDLYHLAAANYDPQTTITKVFSILDSLGRVACSTWIKHVVSVYVDAPLLELTHGVLNSRCFSPSSRPGTLPPTSILPRKVPSGGGPGGTDQRSSQSGAAGEKPNSSSDELDGDTLAEMEVLSAFAQKEPLPKDDAKSGGSGEGMVKKSNRNAKRKATKASKSRPPGPKDAGPRGGVHPQDRARTEGSGPQHQPSPSSSPAAAGPTGPDVGGNVQRTAVLHRRSLSEGKARSSGAAAL